LKSRIPARILSRVAHRPVSVQASAEITNRENSMHFDLAVGSLRDTYNLMIG